MLYAEEKVRVARLSVYSNSSLVAIKVIVGVMMGSVAVISEAVHSVIDLLAAVIARYSVKISAEPADQEHRYGHGKYENLSGMIEGALIFAGAGIIIYEAMTRLFRKSEVELLGAGMAVMAFSACLNFLVARKLMKTVRRTESLALEADAYHLYADVWTSVGVFAGLALIQLTDQHWLDPAIALVVAALILRAAFDITKRATEGLLDRSLPESEMRVIERILSEHESQILSFHKLRARKTGSERQIDLHMVVPRNLTVKQGHDLVDHLEQDIKAELPGSVIVVHVEPCDERCEACQKTPPAKPFRGESKK